MSPGTTLAASSILTSGMIPNKIGTIGAHAICAEVTSRRKIVAPNGPMISGSKDSSAKLSTILYCRVWPNAKRKYLVDIGVGGPKHHDRAELLFPIGSGITSAFAKVNMHYTTGKCGELNTRYLTLLTSDTPSSSPSTRSTTRKNPGLTKTRLIIENTDSFSN